VSAVPAACGDGFVSVSTSTAAGTTNSDVYVVRTTAAGAPLWERRYDLGPGAQDHGESIAVLAAGDGFVVAGSTQPGRAASDAFLMRLDCAGGILWLNAYGGAWADGAFDVIEAQSGDAAFRTAAGDLVAAGFTTSPTTGLTEAILFRVRPDGALVWQRRYDTAGAATQFRALTEARAIAPALTGDIVAAGSFNRATSGLGEQGLAARVNGNSGLIGAAPQCVAHYGDANTQRFEAVAELRLTTSVLGHLVFGGVNNSAATSNDIYLVRTLANPCVPQQQQRIGDPTTGALGDEWLFGLTEVSAAMPSPNIAPLGSLALTGFAGDASTPARDNDAFLVVADPITLIPAPGSARLYGDFAARHDVGVSIVQHSAGFTIAGATEADPQSVGDPLDLYLIHTDPNGQTTCDVSWSPKYIAPTYPAGRVLPVTTPFGTASTLPAEIAEPAAAFQACP
jgi:hypothetical protein